MSDFLFTGALLLLAHVLTDFVFQTGKIIQHKHDYGWKSWRLMVHALTAGILALILSMQWSHWLLVGVGTAASHWIIDIVKLKSGQKGLRAFVGDQFAHIAIVVSIALYIHGIGWTWSYVDFVREILPYVLGLVLIFRPTGFLIDHIIKRWIEELDDNQDTLPAAGRWIGYLERFLIFIFVILQQYAAIGLLIAAKSILRFRDTDSRQKITEYILLGTLLSFTCAIVIAFFTLFLVSYLTV